MARSDELIKERSEYYAFKEQIANLIIKISNSIEAYSSPKNKIGDMYQINNENGDEGKVYSEQQKLNTLVSNLTNTTLVAIQQRIDQLSSEIQAALNAEEEERRRQEEEAAKTVEEVVKRASSSSN